jgi:hypothetical protein
MEVRFIEATEKEGALRCAFHKLRPHSNQVSNKRKLTCHPSQNKDGELPKYAPF